MYRSLEEICKEAAATGCSFWELIQKDTLTIIIEL